MIDDDFERERYFKMRALEKRAGAYNPEIVFGRRKNTADSNAAVLDAELRAQGGKRGFTPYAPQAGKKYSGVITYVDCVRSTFVTQYEYESGRFGYPVEHSMDKLHFPEHKGVYSPAPLLEVGDVVEVSYPRGKSGCSVTVKDTAATKRLIKKWDQEKAEREARLSALDKELIEKYADPKNEEEAKTKMKAILRESYRNKRFENVKVIAKDDERHTVTTSNGKGDEFIHDARKWGAYDELQAGDAVSIKYYDYLKRPLVKDFDEEERVKAAGYGDPNFAKGGEFDHVTITAIDREKNTITTQDAQGKTVVHDARRWGGISGERGVFRMRDTALYEVGDVVSIRIPKTLLDKPYSVLNYTYFKRIVDKYKLFERPGLLDYLICYPAHPPGTDWLAVKSADRTIDWIGRFFDYNLADELNPYKGLTLAKIDKDKNTITAVNSKGEESVHSIAGCRYINSLRIGDIIDVRYNDLERPEKGLKVFDRSAYERQKAKDRFKEVRVIAVDREKDVFTTQSKTGEKFTHSMKDYKWKSRLQPGHLVTIQYKDNGAAKAMDVFNHTTYQESLIKALARRTQQALQERRIRGGVRTFTAAVTCADKNSVLLADAAGKEKAVFVSRADLAKALGCKSSDLMYKDKIQIKVKTLPKTGGACEILSAESADIKERIEEEERGWDLGR